MIVVPEGRNARTVTHSLPWGFRAMLTKPHDGDSFWMLCDTGFGDRHEPELRLYNVHAPEIKPMQPGGQETTDFVNGWLAAHTSKGLDGFNGQEFDAAVTMGCGDECPLVVARQRLAWQIPDPKEMPPERFREVRDLIEAKVKELLETLT